MENMTDEKLQEETIPGILEIEALEPEVALMTDPVIPQVPVAQEVEDSEPVLEETQEDFELPEMDFGDLSEMLEEVETPIAETPAEEVLAPAPAVVAEPEAEESPAEAVAPVEAVEPVAETAEQEEAPAEEVVLPAEEPAPVEEVAAVQEPAPAPVVEETPVVEPAPVVEEAPAPQPEVPATFTPSIGVAYTVGEGQQLTRGMYTFKSLDGTGMQVNIYGIDMTYAPERDLALLNGDVIVPKSNFTITRKY